VIVLRGGVELDDPLGVALELVEKYARSETFEPARATSFDESDLRQANRDGARIAAVEIAAILERRVAIERALREIPHDASLVAAPSSIPWAQLTRLFDPFADIRGVGFSKMTKALHRKRPALIPMLDSVVQAYLATDASGSFGERATALVRSYKLDLDRNRSSLRAVRRELARRNHQVSEVRILDLLIWSVFSRAAG
jgi:Family of unknown function (DUF6308)